jgi:hypothetical protein
VNKTFYDNSGVFRGSWIDVIGNGVDTRTIVKNGVTSVFQKTTSTDATGMTIITHSKNNVIEAKTIISADKSNETTIHYNADGVTVNCTEVTLNYTDA